MRRNHGLLLFLVGSFAASACGGQIVLGGAEGDGGPAATGSTGGTGGTGGSGGSGGTGGGTSGGGGGSTTGVVDSGTGSSVGSATTCAPIPAGAGAPGKGTPVVLANLTGGDIALDSQYAYVASYEVGPVYRVALEDGTTMLLDSLTALNVAVNSTSVFSVGYLGGNVAQGLVVSCSKTGCGGSYTTLASGQSNVWGVAADDTNVYWTNAYGSSELGLMKAPANGGAATALVTSVAGGAIALGGGRVFYISTEVNQSGGSGLFSVPIAGGAPTELVPPPEDGSVFNMTLDCANVYYTLTDGTVGKVPFAGGPPVVLATEARQSLQIAVDAANLYFGSQDGIAYVPVDGGPAQTIPGTSRYTGIAVDATSIYWTSTSGGLLRLAK